ncbi:MAG TPA: dihydrolipoyllysine-residue succinyltransferase [Vicinamibacteria bacterium]|nr:dihydrolipoyllysine-residue succinyltransferase [Vicinamibacteria bacterium]
MTEVIMPQMGESIAEGTIIKWYKQVGDRIERDEPLFEISTDKVDTEIPAPASGILAEVRVQEGETVAINTIVALIESEGSTTRTEAAPPDAKPQEPTSKAPPPPPREERATDGPRSSPLVRKMAEEHGIDLSELTGTGRDGRISKGDVLEFLEKRKAAPPAEAPPPTPSVPPPPPSPSVPAHERPSEAPVGRVEVEPMSVMRRSIAEHMIVSRRTSAHVTTVFEADVSHIVRAREAARHVFERDEGVKLTYTPFFVRAVTSSLKNFPVINARIDGDTIVYNKEYNIGVAVALDDGLIVPVIRQADEKSFLGLARAVADLAERARTKKLRPEEVQGGTFTLTNPGPYGALFGTPIINQPQVAILGLGGIHKRPVIVNDAIAVRSMVYLALSFDHRLIDGATADQFMADVKRRLEGWDEKVW